MGGVPAAMIEEGLAGVRMMGFTHVSDAEVISPPSFPNFSPHAGARSLALDGIKHVSDAEIGRENNGCRSSMHAREHQVRAAENTAQLAARGFK
jgi:hypothetical protein